MRTCENCERELDLTQFCRRSLACLGCVHAWWKEHGPGKSKVSGKRTPAEDVKGRQMNLSFGNRPKQFKRNVG
jgi:hypothetical protein